MSEYFDDILGDDFFEDEEETVEPEVVPVNGSGTNGQAQTQLHH